MAAPLILNTPFSYLCFAGYHLGKNMQKCEPDEQLTAIQHFKTGMWAGYAGSVIMTPAERIKCLLQVYLCSLIQY